MKLSDESRLLIQKWKIVEDILASEKRLRMEMHSFLLSLEEDFQTTPWWSDGWEFKDQRQGQIYITLPAWRTSKDPMLWIGLEQFTPEAVFGDAKPPKLFVWLPGKHAKLAPALADVIVKHPSGIMGERGKGYGGYVVWQYLPKCLPEALDKYSIVVREQATAFIGHYAAMAGLFDAVLRQADMPSPGAGTEATSEGGTRSLSSGAAAPSYPSGPLPRP